jgi:hypothetical protein
MIRRLDREGNGLQAPPVSGENDDQIGGVAVDDITLMPIQHGFTAPFFDLRKRRLKTRN